MSPTAIIIPDDALLVDVAAEAKARHLHLISNGRRAVLSPVIPAGWHKVQLRFAQNATRILTTSR